MPVSSIEPHSSEEFSADLFELTEVISEMFFIDIDLEERKNSGKG